MDFAKFATEYLNQQTEGDPSFMVSDEALAFVDLMRRDDLDRRATQASQATNPNDRGEPTHEEVSDSVIQRSQSIPGDEPESTEPFQEQSEDTMPAAPASEVALRPDTLQASDSLFNQSSLASPQDAAAAESFRESGVGAESSEAVRDDGPEPELANQFSADSLPTDSELAAIDQLFSSAANSSVALDAQFANQSLQDEGVTVTEINSGHNETVILQPESLPDFNAMLRSFDKNYRPPDPQVGDNIEIPSPPDLSDSEPMESSTEFAESMVAEMSEDFLNSSRRKP